MYGILLCLSGRTCHGQGRSAWLLTRVSFYSSEAPVAKVRKGREAGGRSRGRRRENIKLPWFPFRRRTGMNTQKFTEGADWSSLYPTSRPYDPFVIPLPIRMGRAGPGEVAPPAVGNHELLKIPNFFHLTPPAIAKHCAALKPLCTSWPDNLPHLPLTVVTRNYVFPSASIRHTGARVVKLTVRLSDIDLTDRAWRKMIRLCGERYNPATDQLTLVGRKCPTRAQNNDYIMYLLKVLYVEANKTESWELEEPESSGDSGH